MEALQIELPADLKRKIALELSPPDIISLCATSKQFNTEICNSKEFWRLKLQKDFPSRYNLMVKNKLVFINPKQSYIREFLLTSIEIDKFLDNFKSSENNREGLFKEMYSKVEEIGKIPGTTAEIQDRLYEWISKKLFPESYGSPQYVHDFVRSMARKLKERQSL